MHNFWRRSFRMFYKQLVHHSYANYYTIETFENDGGEGEAEDDDVEEPEVDEPDPAEEEELSKDPNAAGVPKKMNKKYKSAMLVFATFCMSKCKHIHQLVPYSPACILAGMMGNVPITIMKEDIKTLAWKPCLKMIVNGDVFDHEVDFEELRKVQQILNGKTQPSAAI